MWGWIQTNFSEIDTSIYNVYEKEGILYTINQDQCNSLFNSIINPTYASLSSLPCAIQGWQQIFDQWKQEGKIQ
jgi:hypothetical protein